jgi:hypothetical protein
VKHGVKTGHPYTYEFNENNVFYVTNNKDGSGVKLCSKVW